jgi:hypothetical protein
MAFAKFQKTGPMEIIKDFSPYAAILFDLD